MRHLRPHDAHVKLPREVDVGHEGTEAAQQWRVFETRDGLPDDGHGASRMVAATWRTAFRMPA